jgi:hypothetical protein
MTAPVRLGGQMPTLEERVAYLEGRLGDHFAAVDDLRVTTRELRADVNRQFADVRGDFADVRGELGQLRTDMTRQFDDVRSGLRTEMAHQFGDVRTDARNLEDQFHQQFRWLVGVQVTSLVAVGSAVVGLYFK